MSVTYPRQCPNCEMIFETPESFRMHGHIGQLLRKCPDCGGQRHPYRKYQEGKRRILEAWWICPKCNTEERSGDAAKRLGFER